MLPNYVYSIMDLLIRGWHLHPIENPDVHNDIDFMNVEDIIKALPEAWALLP